MPAAAEGQPSLLLALLVALAACSSAGATTSTDIRVVDPVAAAELLEAEPDRTIIDVRTPGEYATGHIEGAVLVDYDAPDFEERIAEFDRDDDYLILPVGQPVSRRAAGHGGPRLHRRRGRRGRRGRMVQRGPAVGGRLSRANGR